MHDFQPFIRPVALPAEAAWLAAAKALGPPKR
jgi:hypothetical protein